MSVRGTALTLLLLAAWGQIDLLGTPSERSARADEAEPPASAPTSAADTAGHQWAWVLGTDGKTLDRLPGRARFVDGRLTFALLQGARVLEAHEIWAIELAAPELKDEPARGPPPTGAATNDWWLLGTAEDRLRTSAVRYQGDRWDVSLGTEVAGPGRNRNLPRTAWRGLVRESPGVRVPRLPTARELELDLLALAGGEEVYGQLESLSAEGVRWGGPFGSHPWPLEQVQAVRLRRGPHAPAVAAGCHVRLMWVAAKDRTAEPLLQSLSGVLTGIDPGAWQIVHAEWGELAVQTSALRRVELEWVGRRWLLDRDTHHLGNEAEAAFEVYAPEATRWERVFLLEEAPAEAARLTVVVQDLEPIDSPHVIRTTPEGHLLTHVELNGQALDTLNRHVPGDGKTAQRVHLTVPKGRLQAGENRLVVRQTHAQDDAAEFDDCQLGPVWLEVAAPP